jgi:hypothetical protein
MALGDNLLTAIEPTQNMSGLPAGMSPIGQTALMGQIYGGGAGGSLNASQSQQQAVSNQASTSFIPNYSETPILESIAKQAQGMAPQVYQWGMDQYNKNQGNIDSMMRQALTYASPQRQAVDMGQAEAGVQQASEAGRQSALSDLQSYGIDPSAGRYAGLDQAARVQAGASAAGAGNQQRMADVATGNAMQNQAISSSLQNVQTGYGAANAANALLGTASSLKYAPLGTVSSGSSQSSGSSGSIGFGAGGSGSGTDTSGYNPKNSTVLGKYTPFLTQLGPVHGLMAAGGPVVGYQPGGDVSYADSPSNGQQVDDVSAKLNAGEFVIPRDVTQWLGQSHFYKLMAQARKARATAGSDGGKVGYGAN